MLKQLRVFNVLIKAEGGSDKTQKALDCQALRKKRWEVVELCEAVTTDDWAASRQQDVMSAHTADWCFTDRQVRFYASGEAPSHGWWLHQAGSHLASVLWIWSMQQKVDINPSWSSVGLKMRHKCSLNVKKVTLKLKRNGNLKQTFKTFVCEGSPSSRWGYPEVVSWQLLSLTKPVGREAKRFFIQEVQKEDQLPSINFWIGGSLENKKWCVIVQVKYKIQQTETWRRSCENALLNFDELYTHPAPEKLIPRVHSPPPHLWAQTWVLGKSHINMLTSYQCQVQPVDGKKAESAGDI